MASTWPELGGFSKSRFQILSFGFRTGSQIEEVGFPPDVSFNDCLGLWILQLQDILLIGIEFFLDSQL